MPKEQYVDRMRVTDSLRRMLRVLVDAEVPLSGLDITQRAELHAGTIHPKLAALETREWITSEWEIPVSPDVPRRRVYRMTPFGRTRTHELLGDYDPANEN